MSNVWHPERWPASVALPLVWGAYALALLITLPWTPLGVLWMLGPLLVTGWYARNWLVPAAVGLGHGVALAALTIWLGVFPLSVADPGLALAAGLLVLLSWFTTIAGRTIKLVNVVRAQDRVLSITHQEMDESAASVEAIWDATSVALITLASDATIISWNPGAEQVFHRSADSMQGQSLSALSVPDDPDDCTGPILYALETQRRTPPFEGRLLDGRGHVLDVEVRARPVTHPGGDEGLILTVIDRTREHAMEDILEEQAERQDRLLQNLEEVLYSVEVPSRRTAMLTKTVEGLTGHSIAEFGDFQEFLDLAHPDDRQAVLDRWEHARSGEKSTLRWRIATGQGNHVWVEDRVVPVRNEEGRVVRLDGIVRRILREIELERQAQRMTRWLDALEPVAATGAWSVDLRNGEWSWSPGMARFLGTDQAEYENWARCVVGVDTPILEAMVDHPESFASPQRIHMIDEAGDVAPFVLEAWIQRGNDGEPIHLYGVLRQEAPIEAPMAAVAGTRAMPRRRPARPLPRAAIEKVWPASESIEPVDHAEAFEEAALAEPEEETVEVDLEDLEAEAGPVVLDEPDDDGARESWDDVEPDLAVPGPVGDAGPDDWVTEADEAIEEAAVAVEPEREVDEEPIFDESILADDDPDLLEESTQEPPPLAEVPPAAAQQANVHAAPEPEPDEAIGEATWDDDVGWVPAKRPQPLVAQEGKDASEEVTAKQWADKDRPKPKGPWSLD